ncbi:DUF3244 domain-containing protein [Belliella kenyensis]|uniref:DUF3244 domain-containing protein n=1 Tax=Belliella kenyensis TaxID=1472724 RepID=A0ABV8EJZ6_9BACT|nr:DUF3244 domain-containing protein [Belliella kenyensis]MCH7400232.1 DUF3244 domain-containing protein [Belliella kenyensis]MDN3604751.1 DUF3244 domain-containing protein [Belliella kenyensis]
MKTLMTLAMVLSMSIASMANEGIVNVSAASKVKVNGKSFTLSLDETLGKVRVVISNPQGKTIHQQVYFIEENTKVPFNLSNLPEGTYHVEIASLEKRHVVGKTKYDIKISNSEPMALPLMASFKPIDDNKIRLSVVGLEIPGLLVKIKDARGQVVFKEYINEEGGFQKIYNFQKLNTNGFTMELEDAKGRFKTLAL